MGGESLTGEGAGRTRRGILSTVGTGLAALAGCIVHGEDSGVSGEIQVDGSNTVLPHSASVAEEFMWKNNRVQIPVRGSGTGAGFNQFCTGATDVQNASRPLTDDEASLCAEEDIAYYRLEVALDGLAIFAHPDNECDCLTVEQLKRIWEPNPAETWAEIDDDWPDEPFARYGRDTASGTFDYFTEAITGERGSITSDYSPSADTNVIVRGVSGDRHAIGFGGAGYYRENRDDLKLIAVDDGDDCVRPTTENIEAERYTPLTRPLYLYVSEDALAREEVQAFTRFYYEEIDDEAAETDVVDAGETLTWSQWAARQVGFFGLPDERVEENRRDLEDAIAEVSDG